MYTKLGNEITLQVLQWHPVYERKVTDPRCMRVVALDDAIVFPIESLDSMLVVCFFFLLLPFFTVSSNYFDKE